MQAYYMELQAYLIILEPDHECHVNARILLDVQWSSNCRLDILSEVKNVKYNVCAISSKTTWYVLHL